MSKNSFTSIVIGTAVAFTLYLQGVVDIGPVKASMIASIEPVSATLFAFVCLSTPFKDIDLIGFAMILVTIYLLALPSEQVSNSQLLHIFCNIIALGSG